MFANFNSATPFTGRMLSQLHSGMLESCVGKRGKDAENTSLICDRELVVDILPQLRVKTAILPFAPPTPLVALVC